MKFFVLLLMLFSSSIFAIEGDMQVCFTPGQNCEQQILNAIDSSKNYVHVQAYQLTSRPIETSLMAALGRGVKIIIILDKSQYSEKRIPEWDNFINKGALIYIDRKPAIAHNKIMIIDDTTVITGSYNFTNNAKNRNAENLLLIKSKDIANLYNSNFYKRLMDSATG